VADDARSSLQKTVDEITGYSKRTRKLMWGLAVSIILDITLTVVLGFVSADALSANAALHSSQLVSCANGNIFRTDQDTIWRDFIGLIAKPSAGEPAAQVARTDKLAASFLTYVTRVNHAINCTALYRK
jgi:hypothetical protein